MFASAVRRNAVARKVLAAAATVACLVLAGCSGSASEPPGDNVGTRLHQQVPASLLHLPLRDETGRTRQLADFGGKVLVISDAMTLCQETCPIDTAELVQTARRIDAAGQGAKVEFLSITVDPERDTPHRLAAYRGLFARPPDNWTLLTGKPADVHALWKWFGVYWHKVPDGKPAPRDWLTGRPLSYDVTHSDEVFFLQGGLERFLLEGRPHVAKGSEIPPRLYRFMSAAGHHNVHHAEPGAWTVGQAVQVIRWLEG